MRKRILITGASGFLGSHLMYQLDPGEVIGTYGSNAPGDARYEYLQLDLNHADEIEAVVKEVQPEIIIHAAAKSNLDWCEKHPSESWKINTSAAIKLAEVSKRCRCRYLFVSSDMVFDGTQGDYSEEDETRPISLYGKEKVAAEQGILQVHPAALIARVSLIYGIPVAPGRGYSFLNWILDRLNRHQEVPLFYDQYRTPVEVQDCARALLQLAQSDYSGIVHVAGKEKVDRFTFGSYVADLFGYDKTLLKRKSLKDNRSLAPRPADLSLKTDLLHRLLGGSLSDCRQGLQKYARLQVESEPAVT